MFFFFVLLIIQCIDFSRRRRTRIMSGALTKYHCSREQPLDSNIEMKMLLMFRTEWYQVSLLKRIWRGSLRNSPENY